MRIILFLILIMVCLLSCKQSLKDVDTTASINLSEVSIPSYYDYFSKMEIIPLETNDSSLINDVSKLIYRNGYYYILDSTTDQILMFNSEGKYTRIINKRGNGPGEYTELSDFNFNNFTGDLDLLVPMGGIYHYDTLGNVFKGKTPLPRNVPAAHYFQPLGKETYFIFSHAKEGKKMLVYDTDWDKAILEMYNIPTFILCNTVYKHSYTPFYVLDNQIHFVQGYNGDVFTIDKDGMKLKYHWDFGEQNFNIEDLPERDMQYYMKYMRTIGARYANAFTTFGENSHFFVAKFLYDNKSYTLFYDKEQNKAIAFTSFKEGNVCVPIFLDDEAMYSFVNPAWGDVLQYIGEVDANVTQQVEQISPESNPVIIKNVFK